MTINTSAVGFHDAAASAKAASLSLDHWDRRFAYTFENFFHPFVGELVSKLNRESLRGMLDANWQESLQSGDPSVVNPPDFFESLYKPTHGSQLVSVEHRRKEIDLSAGGPYSNYNWELFFHVPLTIAVHLGKAQRFAEAQRWFHYIFDPTSQEATTPASKRVWKFLAFRRDEEVHQLDYLLALLSKEPEDLAPGDAELREQDLNALQAILSKPFQPHAVARTRQLAYRYSVVMKYLDNLIAWGDHLFRQDTVESINEATQLYVLAANLLGPRPQRIPPRGTVRPKTFRQLKDGGLDAMGNALVELEGNFPFNLVAPPSGTGDGSGAGPLFGIGRTLYFCVPRNEKLLGYWDTVADRLFKIRHCMNLAGIVRQLALFDPPLDPGMLVKAAAAGIDIGSIVNGLNQPAGPLRALALIQKALELCAEVRGLGGALLSALEKRDAEQLALTRQRHEIRVHQLSQEVRFLQWQSAREATKSLLTGRAAALERLHFYARLLGLPADQNVPDTLALDRRELTEENFDEAYGALVGQYDKPLTLQGLPELRIHDGSSSRFLAGATGPGSLYLNTNENADLNIHSPNARDSQILSMALKHITPVLSLIPQFPIHIAYLGMGGEIGFGGDQLSQAARLATEILDVAALIENYNATNASKTASYQRRADEWLLQYNLAAHDLMQNGRQILGSLIAEQIAHREYLNTQRQLDDAREVDTLLREKFTNEELYLWMQGELSRLYYEYYRFAFDTARRAEQTMKRELMRPEVDAQDFVKFNYWDGGRKGLLSGEALYLDVKRMEMAYHDNYRRELELTRHVSLRQLDPLALLKLKTTGSCDVTIPEWLYDRDHPGHYMRRIKNVGVSVPAVVGPYASVNCTLSLKESRIRTSPDLREGYAWQGPDDDRFAVLPGGMQSIVTSSANNDSGLFETNLRDERLLPFEGEGAVSSWKLELPDPEKYPSFDYATISDVILHVRYTARQGVQPGAVNAALQGLFDPDSPPRLALLFSLPHDFPTEWAAFVNGTGPFAAAIRADYFPYFAQGKTIKVTVTGLDLYDSKDLTKRRPADNASTLPPFEPFAQASQFTVTASPDSQVLKRSSASQVVLIVRYGISPAP
jgi:hypothetical protein